MTNSKKQLIAHEIIKVLKSRFDSYPDEGAITRNAPFHKAFLSAFTYKLHEIHTNIESVISMSSWMHGLNTTLGLSFFENTSHILCGGEKRTFKDNSIYKQQVNSINRLMTDLKNNIITPNVICEDEMIADNAYGDMQSVPNFTVDCFYEESDRIVAIELKSVRPNSGEIRGEKQKILFSKAALTIMYPNKKVYYYFGFPFDPLSDTDTGYDKARFMDSVIEFSKFCAPDEILIADELWSFLAEEDNTMAELLLLIKSIATMKFDKEIEYFYNPNYLKHDTCEYLQIARRWNLLDEIMIAGYIDMLSNTSEKSVQRALNKCAFNANGEYNAYRAKILLEAILKQTTNA